MNYGEIKKTDIANGLGVRVALFVSGCENHCPGCFQPETWDYTYGKEFTKETEQEILDALKPIYIEGFSLLGGEPFEYSNQAVLAPFLEKIKATYPKKDIWCYTGYRMDRDLLKEGGRRAGEDARRMLNCIDILVDGPFNEALKDITLLYRGSSNQRLIDVQESLKTGDIVLFDPSTRN